MTSPLKPCPFCGKPAESAFVHASIPWWQVECTDCSAHVDAETEVDAIAAWNTRASTASEAERVREAASALVAKLDECDPHLTSMFSFALAHDHLYSGPTYGEELEALRAAIRSLPIGEA